MKSKIKKDIHIGDHFGRLEVIGQDPKRERYWVCKCNCEKETIKPIRKDHLLLGETLSCGCIASEKTKQRNIENSTSFFDWCNKNQRKDLLERWDYDLNAMSPKDIAHYSRVKIYLKCPSGKHSSHAHHLSSHAKYVCPLCYKENTIYFPKETREKINKTNLERYGTTNPLNNPVIREKARRTCLRKYGVRYPLSNSDIYNKVKATNVERYGVENPFASPEIQAKIKDVNLEKYGVEHPMQNEDVRKTLEKTLMKKYGVKYALKNKEIREKANRSLYNNGTAPCSSQQRYICNLYSGKLNYPIDYYHADMLLPDNIICEYDGAGHDLCVRIGTVTEKEFLRKEIIRGIHMRKNGYKEYRIISSTDNLPSDETLLDMLNKARKYLLSTSHTWINFYVDKGIVCNAEHRDGFNYNYGALKNLRLTNKITQLKC